ncbi:MAG: Ig-like domain-containing protein, partial [Candidatus Bipolaricaulaceae bacterium]
MVVRETYPACFLFSSATPPPTSGNNEWAFAVIPAGETRTLTITGTVSSGCTDDLVNRVEVRSDTPDPVPGNNSYTLTTPLVTRADLAIEKSGPVRAVAGEGLTYVLVIKNLGPSDARDVIVAETYPTGFVFLTATPMPTSGNNVWALGDLVAGGQQSIVITGMIQPDVLGLMRNTASVRSATEDPNMANNEAHLDTQVEAVADLAITKQDQPDPVVAGESLTYVLVVTNHGPSVARDVVVREAYPPSFRFSWATPAPTSGNNIWSLGTLGVGESVRITISGAVAPEALGTLENTAWVTSSARDPNPGNNQAVEPTTVVSVADLAIAKRATVGMVTAGELLTYVLEVSNAGPSAAQQVVVTEDYPEWFAFLEATPSPDAGTTNRWTFALLLPNERVTIQIIGRVSRYARGQMTNWAAVATQSMDPDLSNNEVLVITAIDAIVIAEDDAYEVLEDSALGVAAPGVLANDHYPDGLCSLRVVEGTKHGTLQLGPDGSFTYAPTPNFYGKDSFVYEICDCDGDCDTAVVTLEVLCLNDPVRGEDVDVRTCVDEAVALDLVVYDADILADDFRDHPLVFEVVHGPEHGTLTADWTNVTYRAGQAVLPVVYVPDPGFVGEDGFVVRVSDIFGDTDYIRVRVEVSDCGRRPVGAAGELLIGPVVIHEISWAGTPASPED